MNNKPARKRKNATLETVAQEAKVHVATAATILNGAKSNTRVSSETRQRVMDVAARLGYRPNRLAQNLRRQRTMTVGLVAGTVENPFFAHMATLCERFLLDAGYELVMAMDAGRFRDDRSLLETLFARGVDGVIYWNGRESEGRRLVEEGVSVPVVLCGYASPRVDSVGVDFYGGAQMAMEHLLARGCRRIAYFIPSEAEQLTTAQMRVQSYRDALAAHGLEPRVIPYEGTVGDIGHAREAAEALGRGDNPPDALFCFNDLAAVGAMMGLRRAGRRVPEDVAVVGYDAIPLAAELDVPLTTVDMPIEDVCRAAVEMLMRRFGPDAPEEPQSVVLVPRVVVRASSGGTTSAP
jgi:DNA-binding LacI/PurR family transcriptional regulator